MKILLARTSARFVSMAAAVLMFTGVNAAHAAVVVADGTTVTMVEDFTIGGTETYDVSWIFGSASSAYGPLPGTFPIGSQMDAVAAATELNTLLNTGTTAYTAVRAQNGTDYDAYFLGYRSEDPMMGPPQIISASVEFDGASWDTADAADSSVYAAGRGAPYAVFTPTVAVPAPATALLFGAALLALGAHSARRNRRS